DAEKKLGWYGRNEIAYSPQITLSEDGKIQQLFEGVCAGYDEWYVFDAPRNLGALCKHDDFESDMPEREVWTFASYDNRFALHNPDCADLTNRFWKQLERIQPESFIADSDALLTFVTRDEAAFDAACNFLRR